MNTLSEINKMQELFNSNRILLNSLIGYCRHDVNKTDEITNILSGLEIIFEQQNEIDKLRENLCKN